jgi:hypothetical protein
MVKKNGLTFSWFSFAESVKYEHFIYISINYLFHAAGITNAVKLLLIQHGPCQIFIPQFCQLTSLFLSVILNLQ